MSGSLNARDLPSVVTNLLRRVENLERLGRNPATSAHGPAIFNLTGSVAVSTSDPDVAAVSRHYTRLGAGLTTAGSSTTTFAVKVDGATLETVSLGSGVTEKVVSVSVAVPRNTPLQVAVTAAGTGAAGLVVRLD